MAVADSVITTKVERETKLAILEQARAADRSIAGEVRRILREHVRRSRQESAK